mmetsp:Transcript_11323/g.34658  ORF Transcript_11323/g.34658 Transcript_11323/m.34658 type:complete len:490 (+) Transcript_11323:282-1751(+)|eukprot:CAMPEP_0198728358 /NCGR_PEP_ID=MMETSP1475-20131203/8650_1 /TAXON_ID= ORGANISM="Unidentified sp., Strain CCMP1999" /NCGR_SAMPLE_ID=MMETSP1475 /ASSEMBLY_ACC=CAM_ASM_001111 /LENGTH=489 /DNA_ID=CAMNT_0044490691 /DNA_START=233 /DNA_END=1702 /DNA_ORIENTATION=-
MSLAQRVATLEAEVTALERDLLITANAMNTFFTLITSTLVFLMQGGFAMLEAGSVRTKNTKNVLLKNVLDACCGVVGFYLFGYAFLRGEPANVFIGYGSFALSYFPKDMLRDFFFQWTFAATSATVVSGSVAERTSFSAYLLYTFLLTSFVYPVSAHWVWSRFGWLSPSLPNPLFNTGLIDFAGSLVVHTVGGFAGLIGAIIVGPRLGRFDEDGRVNPMPGHSATLVTLGSFLLWFGWYGFNTGSTGLITLQPGSFERGNTDFRPATIIQLVAVNTTISAAIGGITVLGLVKLRDGLFDLISSLNGILAGLVSITAGCAFVEPYAAVIIGFIGAIVYVIMSWVLLLLRIDDPLDAFPVHGACGIWGIISVAFFARRYLLRSMNYPGEEFGLIYGGGGRLLAAQVVGAVCIVGWVLVVVGAFFYLMKRINILRISPEEEMRGNDQIKHGGGAYPEMRNQNRRKIAVDYQTRRDEDEEGQYSDSDVVKEES